MPEESYIHLRSFFKKKMKDKRNLLSEGKSCTTLQSTPHCTMPGPLDMDRSAGEWAVVCSSSIKLDGMVI